MSKNPIVKKSTGSYILLHIMAMFVLVLLVVVGIIYATNIYTRHGEAISVPNVCDKKFSDAEHLLQAEGLRVVVSDTGYNRQLPPDYVLHQQPAAGTKVKNNRVIYLSINSSKKPSLVMPDIIDNSSLREATARLKMLGFNVGSPKYISGEKDWVYGAICRGKHVYSGDQIPIDALITLEVGKGDTSEEDDLQYLDPNIGFEIDESASTEYEGEVPVTSEEEDPFVIIE